MSFADTVFIENLVDSVSVGASVREALELAYEEGWSEGYATGVLDVPGSGDE